MTKLFRALALIVLFPSACCVGVYGCTAWNVAAFHHAVTPPSTLSSVLPAGATCCTRSGLAYDGKGNEWERRGSVWVKL